MARYAPAVRATAEAALKTMRARLPGATEFVYDKANSLVIGFGPTERPSDALFSLILYPRWVSLCFITGASLPDPEGVLKGEGNVVRHIVLDQPDVLDRPAVRNVMKAALDDSDVPLNPRGVRRTLIRATRTAGPRKPASRRGSR
jgi:hypothetical protein